MMHMYRYVIKTTLLYFRQKGNVPFLIQRNYNSAFCSSGTAVQLEIDHIIYHAQPSLRLSLN